MNPLKFIRKDVSTTSFKKIKQDENDLLKKRREKAGVRTGDPEKDAIGLALSGGGVRSATFNLGLFQALDEDGILKWIDYLSTVSGGGYIGCSLSWFMAKNAGKFPFAKYTAERPLQWLRRHASYLSPGDGLDIWALIAAFLRGIFINLLIIIPIFLVLIYFLCWNFLPDVEVSGWLKYFIVMDGFRGDFFLLFFWTGLFLLAVLLLFFLFYAVLSRISPLSFERHRIFSVEYGWVLKMAIFLLLLGLLPSINEALNSDFIGDWQKLIISSFSVGGIISIGAGWIGLKGKNETKGLRAFLLRIGLILVIFVILLFAYKLALYFHNVAEFNFAGVYIPVYLLVIISVFISLAIGISSDINHVSMHRYYRDRLMEAYMPDFSKDDVDFNAADTFFFKNIKINESGAPYHIVNATLNTSGSKLAKRRLRGGENFIFSPGYIGSDATGYKISNRYINGQMTLATALSVSGAAVDPNTGATNSRPLSFIMTLLNVRLGYWLMNPKRYFLGNFSAPLFWHIYAFKEMLGWGMNEDNSYVHVGDGGHFENLGIYELIRRKCSYIIISDAGADPGWNFKDLARACERVRVDFNSEIEIDIQPLFPDSGYSEKAIVIGKVTYEDGDKTKNGKSKDKNTGTIIYIKTTVTKKGLPEDIHGYKRAHENFPDESTADQFFDETQFEAYRELGYRTGKMILNECNKNNPKDLFEEVSK